MKEITLSIYPAKLKGFHVHKVSGSCLAQELHYHEYFQIYYVIKGHLTHYANRGMAHLTYGDAFLIPPNVPHRISMDVRDTEFYSISFDRNFLSPILSEDLAAFLTQLSSGPRDALSLKLTIPYDLQRHIQNIVELLISEYESDAESGKSSICHGSGLLLTLLSRLYYTASVSLTENDQKRAVIGCLQFMQDSFSAPLTIEQMVERSKLQRSDFCKLFHKLTGCTFHEMLTRLRINHALMLMTSGSDCTLDEIAHESGYASFVTFYRNFVKQIGMPPSQYMKVHTVPEKTDSRKSEDLRL